MLVLSLVLLNSRILFFHFAHWLILIQFQHHMIENQLIQYRNLCTKCLQPEFGCYCAYLEKFDPKIKFVILIHPIEFKRRIATGRMSHLCLENSEFIVGQDYSNNQRVNDLLNDPNLSAVILYPGKNSINISDSNSVDQANLFDPDKTPTIFVIDGTWATAIKTLRQSQNLRELKQICFTPKAKSQFRVRKQPAAECVSTIEAIHQTIDLLGKCVRFNTASREHDKLLKVFNFMVERQLDFIRKAQANPKPSMYRRPRIKIA